MRNRSRHILPTALSLTAALLACETALGQEAHYRWINERGHEVHSDRPPAAGVDYEVIESGTGLKRVVPRDEGAVPADVNPSVGNEFTQVNEEEANRSKKNPELCERSRSNLEALSGDRRIVVRDEQGEKRLLSDEEIAEARATAEANTEIYCP